MSGALASARAFADSKFGSVAVTSLRAAFTGSRHPMLFSDDGRRWVTGNAAACELLGISGEELVWRTLDDFTPRGQRARLDQRWAAFLSTGAAEGWYQLDIPGRGPVSVEFSAVSHVLPSRHLTVFIPPEYTQEQKVRAAAREEEWSSVVAGDGDRLMLTEREREVMTLVASGMQSAEMAKRLFLSTDTISSHVQNARAKLGSRTRAHAVAMALVTGQISPAHLGAISH